jgi:hypothetical protein
MALFIALTLIGCGIAVLRASRGQVQGEIEAA